MNAALFRIAATLCFLAVALGAFGAHTLRETLRSHDMVGVWEKAVFYHFVHALGILLIAILVRTNTITSSGANRTAGLLLLGIFVFSGSLYALSVTGVRMLGAITPIGGVAFIAGWVLLAFEAGRVQRF